MKRIKNVNIIGTSLVILAISSSACIALAQNQNMPLDNSSSNNGAATQMNNDTKMNANSDSHNVSGSRANTSNTGVGGGEISNLNTVSQTGGYTGSGQSTGSTSNNVNMSKSKPWKSRTSSEPQGTTDSTRNYLK